VRFARLLVALCDDDYPRIAQMGAQMGMRSKHMRTEQFALRARVKYGKMTMQLHNAFTKRLQELDAADPMITEAHDPKIALVEKTIMQLRGTNMFMGVFSHSNTQACWIDYARATVAEHGAKYPEVRVELDLP